VADVTERQEHDWQRASYPATATVTAVHEVDSGAGRATALSAVTWADPLGMPHAGTLDLDRPVPVGTSLPVWVGPDGGPRIPHPSEAAASGVLAGIWALLTGWLVLALLWMGVERLVLRRNCRRWADEWRRVEPIWTGRQPSR
jgi:hypothetical protein